MPRPLRALSHCNQNARLKALVAQLTTTLDQQREAAVQDDAAVVALLTASLQARSAKYLANLDESYGAVRAGLESVVVAHAGRNLVRAEQLGNLAQSNVAAGVQLDRRATEVEVAGVEGRAVRPSCRVELWFLVLTGFRNEQMVEKSFKTVHDELTTYRRGVEASSRDQVDVVTRTAAIVEAGAATCKAFPRSRDGPRLTRRARQVRTDASTSHARMGEDLGALTSSTREGYSSYRSNLASVGQDAEVTTDGIRHDVRLRSLPCPPPR